MKLINYFFKEKIQNKKEREREISVPSSPFFCEPKTAQKNLCKNSSVLP